MPMAKDGSFHLSTQRAMAHESKPKAAPARMATGGGMESEGGGEHSELHPHGDGSYHTMTDGQKTEHPHLTHALAHLAGHHEPEHMHSAVQHHEDGTHTSAHHDGLETSGPHEHENMDALKDHLDNFANQGPSPGDSY